MIILRIPFFCFKENDEKIKIDTPDNDHISKEVAHLLGENLTKGKSYYLYVWQSMFNETKLWFSDNVFQIFVEEPNSKSSRKESKRSVLKLRFPFQNASSEKKSMSFLFTLYLLFVYYAKIDVYWILTE